MPTKTTEEAIGILKVTRSEHIARARVIADELIAVNKSTSAPEVYAEMERRGLTDPTIPKFWLGAVFRSSQYRATGEYRAGSCSPKQHDPHPVKVWTWAN